MNTEKQYQNEEQQTMKSLETLHRKNLKYNVIDQNEFESLSIIFTRNLNK